MVQETRSKVVVRLLPPSLTEDGFKTVIGEWLEATDWISYWKGKPSAQVLNHSRAYLNFKDPSDVFRFKAAFNGKNFVTDKTGQQYRCIVEYAPYQRLSRKKGRYDTIENTIEKDEDYKEFLAKLQAGPEVLPSAEVQLQQKEAAAAAASGDGGSAGVAGPTQTALMQYLKEKRAKKISRKIQRDPAASSKGVKGRGGGGGAAGGGDSGKAKKGKQKKTRKDKEAAAAAAARGEEYTGKGGLKKDKKSKKKNKEKKTAASGGGGGGGVSEQPAAPTTVRILQRPGTSASLPGLGTAATSASGAAPKPKLVPIALPPRPDGSHPAAGGGGGSKRGGRGKGRGGGEGRGAGGGRGEAAAAAGEEGGRGRGNRGGRGGRGRGSSAAGATSSGSQPKVVPIVMVRKPKPPQPAATGPPS